MPKAGNQIGSLSKSVKANLRLSCIISEMYQVQSISLPGIAIFGGGSSELLHMCLIIRADTCDHLVRSLKLEQACFAVPNLRQSSCGLFLGCMPRHVCIGHDQYYSCGRTISTIDEMVVSKPLG